MSTQEVDFTRNIERSKPRVTEIDTDTIDVSLIEVASGGYHEIIIDPKIVQKSPARE
jgi:hypothetical protein